MLQAPCGTARKVLHRSSAVLHTSTVSQVWWLWQRRFCGNALTYFGPQAGHGHQSLIVWDHVGSTNNYILICSYANGELWDDLQRKWLIVGLLNIMDPAHQLYMVIKCDKCPNDLPNRVIYQLVQVSCGIMVNFTHSFLQFVWWGWGPYLVLWGTGECDIYCQVNQHRPCEIGLGRWVSTFHQKLVIVRVYLNLPECQRVPIVFIGV